MFRAVLHHVELPVAALHASKHDAVVPQFNTTVDVWPNSVERT